MLASKSTSDSLWSLSRSAAVVVSKSAVFSTRVGGRHSLVHTCYCNTSTANAWAVRVKISKKKSSWCSDVLMHGWQSTLTRSAMHMHTRSGGFKGGLGGTCPPSTDVNDIHLHCCWLNQPLCKLFVTTGFIINSLNSTRVGISCKLVKMNTLQPEMQQI